MLTSIIAKCDVFSETMMLKIFIFLSVLSIYAYSTAAVHDQNEAIKTSLPKKSIRELCDETVTYFFSNPDAASKLASLHENITQENGDEIIKSANKQNADLCLNDHEQQMIKPASDMYLIGVIKDMYSLKTKKLKSSASSEVSSETTPRKVMLDLN